MELAYLLGVLVLILVFIVFATIKFKIQPFLLLIISAIIFGFLNGMDSEAIMGSIIDGFGNTLSSIGIIIAFGSIIGTYLEKSGGTAVLANFLLSKMGEKRSPLAMNITGLIVSIPVFCDSGFVILSSINKALSKKTGISLVVFAIALSTGLYVSHVFIPPTPGPLAAAAILNADIGLVLLLGIVISMPVSIIGLLWAKFIGKSDSKQEAAPEKNESLEKVEISTGKVLIPILLPLVLIGLRSIATLPSNPLGDQIAFNIVNTLGHPVIALLFGVFAASFLGKNHNRQQQSQWVGEALKNAGLIVLVTGAGGAFGNILRVTNIGELLGEQLSEYNIGIFLPFLIAAILKTAQGSSTVSIITTAAIISPIAAILGCTTDFSRALFVLSIGAGAMTVSHINDSYFWVVSQFSDMNLKTALRGHTIATGLQGLVAIILIFFISILF